MAALPKNSGPAVDVFTAAIAVVGFALASCGARARARAKVAIMCMVREDAGLGLVWDVMVRQNACMPCLFGCAWC